MRNILRILVVIALAIASISSVGGVAVAAPGPGSISGSIYQADGTTPVGAAIVNALNYDTGALMGTAYSSAYDGGYTITGLASGDYRVRVRADGYYTEYYNDATDMNDAEPVAVTDDTDTPDIDFSLAPCGSISGTVYADDNVTPVYSGHIMLFDSSSHVMVDEMWMREWHSDYRVGHGLPAGSYHVKVEALGYFSEYYDNVTDIDDAAAVVVYSENDTPNINFNLTQGGIISGTVYAEDNVTPVNGAHVVVIDSDSHWIVVDEVYMGDDSNAYSVGTDLPSGTYHVMAEAAGYYTEYYDNVTYADVADVVTVTAGAEVTGIDFSLTPCGSISGTIVSDTGEPVYGAHVTAYDNVSDAEVDEVFLGSTVNTYKLGHDMDTGGYHVLVQADGYFDEYYDNASAIGSAATVVVTSPNETSGIDFSLLPHAPMVDTNPAASISATSAVLNGDLTSLGAASSDNVSFEWGLTTSYGNETTLESKTATGTFSANLTSLTPSTTYHFRAKAVGDGTAYGNDEAFTTSTSPPSVTTNAATSVTATTARLNGTITSLGTADNVTVWFEGGTVEGGPYDAPVGSQVMTDIGDLYFDATGLTPGTTYYYRVVADGDGDPVIGGEVSYTTLTAPPTVTTGDATSIATTSATLNGNLTNLGIATSVIVSFEWGTIAGGLYTSLTDNQTMTSAGAFTANLTGLIPGTTYYYKAKAVGDGTASGDEVSFTTLTTPPSVTTSAATSLATTSAELNGSLGSLGTATSVNVSFEWGTTTSYGSETSAQSASAIGAFNANLSGLTANTTYHFRAKAVGHGSAVYGEDMTFTTASLPDTTAPTISAVASSGITTSEATITWTTNEPATSRVEYGLTEEYGSFTTLQTNLVTGHSEELTGLKASKTYHYRVISKDASNNEAVSGDYTFATSSESGGMPVWAWVLIAIAVIAVLGAGAFIVRGRLAQG